MKIAISNFVPIIALVLLSACGGGPDIGGTTTPKDPSGFNITPLSSTSVRLNWSSVVGATAYTLERKTSTSPYVAIYADTATTFTDMGLVASTSYSYRLKTLTQNGISIGVEKSATTLSGGTNNATYDFSSAGNPIDVTPQYDMAHAVTKMFPVTGGSLVLSTSAGVITLEIPGNALLQETEITMTPISSIADLPFSGGMKLGVKLEPDGLRFYQAATLTFEPSTAIPVAEQSIAGFSENGKELHLEPMEMGLALKIKLLHFSGYLAAGSNASERSANTLRQANTSETRLQQMTAELLTRERQSQLLGEQGDPEFLTKLEELFRQYKEQVVKPRIAAVVDCETGKSAIQSLLGYLRQMQLLGMEDAELNNQSFLELMIRTSKLCIDKEYENCLAHKIEGMIPLWLGLERQKQLLGFPQEAFGYEEQKVDQCFRFELEMDSAITSVIDTGFDTAVKTTVPLRAQINFQTGSVAAGGKGYQPTYLNYKVPGCSSKVNFHRGSLFNVDGLRLILGTPPKDGYAPVVGLEMAYAPLPDYGSVTLKCPESTDITLPASPYWTAGYTTLHMDELLSGKGNLATDWAMQLGSTYATKTYRNQNEVFSEITSLSLKHTPGMGNNARDVSGFAALGLSPYAMKLQWDGLPEATEYILERRGLLDDSYVQVARGAFTTYTESSGLYPQASYIYRVKSVTPQGISNGSFTQGTTLADETLVAYAGTLNFDGIVKEISGDTTSTLTYSGVSNLKFERTSDDPGGATFSLTPSSTTTFNNWDYESVSPGSRTTCHSTAPSSGIDSLLGGITVAKAVNLFIYEVMIQGSQITLNCKTVSSSGTTSFTQLAAPTFTYGSLNPAVAGEQWRPYQDGKVLQGSNAFKMGSAESYTEVQGTWSFSAP